VNRGSEPTFVTRIREQVIDVTLSLAIIRFRMSADPQVPHEYRNPLLTDWDCYKTELVSGFGD
jgi:hypothetical protein